MLDTEPPWSAPAVAPVARLRARLARSQFARRCYDGLRTIAGRPRPPASQSFWELPTGGAVRMAYNIVLRREPDPTGRTNYEQQLDDGVLSRDRMVEEMRGSEEFLYDVPFTGIGQSVHTGRCAFIQSLPQAARILDLGGTHKAFEQGAFLRMGYPYSFEELVIVDLPDDDRHPLYQGDFVSGRDCATSEREAGPVETPLGPVSYRYHSMTDLSSYADGSFDLVYMGQSIEHVTEGDGAHVLAEVHRILAPGGWLALDTPNGRITRLQQADFIDPDHEVEYTFEEMTAQLDKACFTIVEAKGMNYAGPHLDTCGFSLDRVAANTGVYAEVRDCYILAFLCSR